MQERENDNLVTEGGKGRSAARRQCCTGRADRNMAKRPNIIYILSDQHNPEVLGYAGDPFVRTPNIDALARSGVYLDNCYCAAPLCVPSRTAILSGRSQEKTGVCNNMQSYSPTQATFVHALVADGYETVLSGRMHFVGPDQRHGYERRMVGDLTPSYPGADNEEMIYGAYKRTSNQALISVKKSGKGCSAVLKFDEAVTDAAIGYLEERRDDRPLFLTVGFYGPHCPYIADPERYDHYYRTLPEIGDISDEEEAALHPAMRRWRELRDLGEVTDDDVRRVRAAYYSMVEYMDSLVGRIVAAVGRTLDPENTVIIYGSDHGDNIGAHGLFWKTNFYEGSARVPLLFSWGGHFAAGRRLKGLTSLLDIAPTVLALAGDARLPEYDGMDLVPFLAEGAPDIPAERDVYSFCSDIKGDEPSAMIRSGRYKLIRHAGYEDVQLFDLSGDPGEMRDLGTDEAYAAVREELMARLAQRWNPEQARAQLAVDKAHFALLKKWVNTVHPEPIEEWYGDNRNNYILGAEGDTKAQEGAK